MNITKITHEASATDTAKGFSCDAAVKNSDFGMKDLEGLGFSFDSSIAQDSKLMAQYAQDAGLALGDANIDALGQFFMIINEQTINALYRGRTAAQAFGVTQMGDWTTERIAFKTRELVAPKPGLYDDHTRAPLTGYNYGWDVRDTIRLEFALEVTKLEEAVAGVMRRNAMSDKKDAVMLADSIFQNDFFWNGATILGGTNGVLGTKKLYGIWNEPNIPAVTSAPADLTDTSTTIDAVIDMMRTIKQTLATKLQGNLDVDTAPIKMLLPIAAQQAFTKTGTNSLTGYTANEWIAKNWKNLTIQFCPELDEAKKMIVFAESVPDVGMKTINLITTSKLRLVGAMPSVKGREEAYSSSVAGAICTCPMAVLSYEFAG